LAHRVKGEMTLFVSFRVRQASNKHMGEICFETAARKQLKVTLTTSQPAFQDAKRLPNRGVMRAYNERNYSMLYCLVKLDLASTDDGTRNIQKLASPQRA
jgi:hypothetical protein